MKTLISLIAVLLLAGCNTMEQETAQVEQPTAIAEMAELITEHADLHKAGLERNPTAVSIIRHCSNDETLTAEEISSGNCMFRAIAYANPSKDTRFDREYKELATKFHKEVKKLI